MSGSSGNVSQGNKAIVNSNNTIDRSYEDAIQDPYGRTVVNYGVNDMAFGVKDACDKVEDTIQTIRSWVHPYIGHFVMRGGRWVGDDLNAISHGSAAQFNLTKDHMFHSQYKMFMDREIARLGRNGFKLQDDGSSINALLDSLKKHEEKILNSYRYIVRANDQAETGAFKDQPNRLQEKVANDFQNALSKYRRRALKFLPILAAVSSAAKKVQDLATLDPNNVEVGLGEITTK